MISISTFNTCTDVSTFKAGGSSSSKSFLTVTWRPYTPVEICGKSPGMVSPEFVDHVEKTEGCGSGRGVRKKLLNIYIYKVSSQTRRFAVQNLRNNDSTPTNPSHIPLSAQVSFSPYYICSLSFPTQLFLSNHLSIFCFGSPFAPPSFPLSSQQVIEMPKKDSTSSDKGASFGGWKPPVVYREGRDMEAQWGWVFLKVQIEVIPWVECGCEEFMFLFLPLVRWWKGWTSVFLGRILRKVKCPNCCGHDISYIHHSKTPLMWQEKSPFVPVTLSRCW